MPRGGVRPGAGRKRGAVTKKTTEIAQRAAADGITPLEVMLDAMRQAHKKKDMAAAAGFAKDAAPYMHPRLSAVALDLTGLSDDDLRDAAQ